MNRLRATTQRLREKCVQELGDERRWNHIKRLLKAERAEKGTRCAQHSQEQGRGHPTPSPPASRQPLGGPASGGRRPTHCGHGLGRQAGVHTTTKQAPPQHLHLIFTPVQTNGLKGAFSLWGLKFRSGPLAAEPPDGWASQESQHFLVRLVSYGFPWAGQGCVPDARRVCWLGWVHTGACAVQDLSPPPYHQPHPPGA